MATRTATAKRSPVTVPVPVVEVTAVVRAGDLAKALAFVAGAAERRSTIPILSSVLFSAAESTLRLVATNLDVANFDEINARVSAPGAVAAAAKLAADVAEDFAAVAT